MTACGGGNFDRRTTNLSSRPSEARAGIHNHRTKFVERGWSTIQYNNKDRWLWVPACAGTTMERNLLRRLQRGFTLFRRDPEGGGAFEQEVRMRGQRHPPDRQRAGDADNSHDQRDRADVVDQAGVQ